MEEKVIIEKALQRLSIQELNQMQVTTISNSVKDQDILVLSPTGSGKTIAFLLPIIKNIDLEAEGVQALVIAPSRELALQIEQVFKKMDTGLKINCFYGGHSMSTEINNLSTLPSLLVGTPGRIKDHLERNTFDTSHIKVLVLDEFDKSLELGFQEEISFITSRIPVKIKKILTSATESVKLPEFLSLNHIKKLNFLTNFQPSKLKLKAIRAQENDKLEALFNLLCQIGKSTSLIFCNHRDAVERISELLQRREITHGIYHGKLDQDEREKALIKFRNGTHYFLLTTDLASRGLDIPEIINVIHYQLPDTEAAYIHRNGRTARMNAEGTSYLVLAEEEPVPKYISEEPEWLDLVEDCELPEDSEWSTVYISGGKKDKINKMDLVGFFIQKGKLDKEDLGKIDVLDKISYVAVNKSKVENLLQFVKGEKVKKQKLKIQICE
jgi:superfamily II DNA/RNA helicase